MSDLDCFAVTAPGLEAVTSAELADLGLDPRAEPGGVAWSGDEDTLARAHLWMRTASRILVRVGSFRARTFFELERRAAALPWERFLPPGLPVELRVTCRKSRLYHEGAVAQRLAEAIRGRTGAEAVPGRRRGAAGDVGEEDEAAGEVGEAGGPAPQLFVVRFFRDVCTVSADASGSLLHRRGYRQELGRAPLRETLAAAMLLAAGWKGDAPLVDPMCGSGTLAIEGALLARRIPPGLRRSFAFTAWPGHDAPTWEALRTRAEGEILPGGAAAILASDRDSGVLRSARANAERAGVAGDVELARRSVSAVEPPPGRGMVVTNPPYGVRVGDRGPLRDLYARFGQVLRSRFGGWTVALLSADPVLERQLRLPLEPRLETTNGGIRVRLLVGAVPEGS